MRLLPLEWRETARTDLLGIIEFLADKNPAAAQRLKDEVEAKAARLATNPRIYRRGRVPGTREMVVRPNYVVVYVETAQAVTILRVLHTARSWPP